MVASRSYMQRSFFRLFLLLILITLSACSGATEVPTPVPTATATPIPPEVFAEITFEAQPPELLSDGQSLFIEFLDEVTGLALNASRARMTTTDGKLYEIKMPVAAGSVIKYRYYRDNDPIGVEYTTRGEQVRYRMYIAAGPGVVRDTIAGWRSAPSKAVLGRITGQVADKTNNAPVVNALVAAGGVQTLTSSDGSFILEGLSPGLHNLVVYSLDGSFQPFQQGAIVASESATPALVLLTPAPMIAVTFIAEPPKDNPKGAPVRLIGNIYSLGNTFADLDGGVNTLASRAPLMQALPDGRYSITLQLPAGLDLRYKYTLGDGFWNSERDKASQATVRQLIVPDNAITVKDTIASWKTPGSGAITFSVTVPEDTPQNDVISIQFNPFGWTQPIPMWRVEQNRWFYVLYNPLYQFTNGFYRYCRNEQCGVADSIDSAGTDAAGTAFTPKEEDQEFTDTISSWTWMASAERPIVIPANQISPRNTGFMTGVEFSQQYRPSWQPYLGSAFVSAKELGSNTVILSPTWQVTYKNPPVMAPVTGHDPLWFDLTQMNLQAQQNKLDVVLHPVLQYNGESKDWWHTAVRDDGWWQTWFARYKTFILYHADMATQTGAKALIISDASILPAYPDGKLSDGSPSNIPGDAETRWHDLIAAVRARYTGKIIWMVPANAALSTPPAFLKDVDMLYVEISPPLNNVSDNAALPDLEKSMSELMDNNLLKLQEKTKKPIIISVNYPSVEGAADGCVGKKDDCQPLGNFDLPGAQIDSVELGLEEQAFVYSAVFSAVNQRSWIAGFFASGYDPVVELRDLSTSVRGKPAGDVLWYWYPKLLGKTNP